MVTKILLFILIFAILNVLREIFKFRQAMKEEQANMMPFLPEGLKEKVKAICDGQGDAADGRDAAPAAP